MLKKIKSLIPHKIKIKLILFRLKFKSNSYFKFNIPSKKKRIFIFLAADYGNLGDVAITYAQHKFLSTTFSDYTTTEIPISQTLTGLEYIKRIIKKEDIITTVGGGNMGDLYQQIENYRQMVIEYFPNNKIICFPQTVDFSETIYGLDALDAAKSTYGNHKHLLLLAREQKTFDYFQTHFPNNKSLLVPDIVMSLDRVQPTFERKNAVICLREDKEKKLTDNQHKELLSIIKSNYKNISFRDTHIGTDFMGLKTRVSELFSIWDSFKKAELVVTDRLHGMIFCFVTNTPVLVLLNNNHKVQSSFEWIRNAANIHLVPEYSAKNIQNVIDQIKSDPFENKKQNLLPKFDKIKEVVLNQL